MQAWLSSLISSRVLITRASCMSCWPSTTSSPPSCKREQDLRLDGVDADRLAEQAALLELDADLLAPRSSARPDCGDIAPRRVEMPARDRPSPSHGL